jgi:hypothetical protein
VSIVPYVPEVIPAQPSPKDYCSQAVPWHCAFGWVPILGAPVAFSQECREAYDLERACMAGGFPRPVAGPGAGPAPPLAAKPGVDYDDPAILREIERQQREADKVRWFQTVEANRNIIDYAPGNEPPEPREGLVLLAALAIVVLGLFIGARR